RRPLRRRYADSRARHARAAALQLLAALRRGFGDVAAAAEAGVSAGRKRTDAVLREAGGERYRAQGAARFRRSAAEAAPGLPGGRTGQERVVRRRPLQRGRHPAELPAGGLRCARWAGRTLPAAVRLPAAYPRTTGVPTRAATGRRVSTRLNGTYRRAALFTPRSRRRWQPANPPTADTRGFTPCANARSNGTSATLPHTPTTPPATTPMASAKGREACSNAGAGASVNVSAGATAITAGSCRTRPRIWPTRRTTTIGGCVARCVATRPPRRPSSPAPSAPSCCCARRFVATTSEHPPAKPERSSEPLKGTDQTMCH